MSTGEKLRYFRKRSGFTQEELAKDICHPTYVSKIENGDIIPPDNTFEDFCEKMGIVLNQLYQRIDEEKWLLLDEWLSQIKNNDIDSSQKQHKFLAPIFDKIDEPFILCYYYLILLRHYILVKDKQKSIQTSSYVKKHEDYSGDMEYDYQLSLGLYEYNYGNLQVALTYFLKAEKILEKKRGIEAEFLYYISLTLSRLNKITLSTIYVYQALKIYNQKMNFDKSTDCNLILGINFNLIGEYEMAEKSFLRVINAANSHKNKKLIKGKAYHNLGNIYSRQGNPAKAIEMLHKSLQHKKEIKTIKSNTYYLLSKEYLKTGDTGNGKKFHSKGESYAKEDGGSDYQLKFNVLYHQYITPEKAQYKNLLQKSIHYFSFVKLSETICPLENLDRHDP